MPVQTIKERNAGKVGVVTIGATQEQGGTRTSVVKIGGESSLPFLHFEGEMPNKPVIAMEVVDRVPEEWNDEVKNAFTGVLDNPVAWAKKCVEGCGADLIFLRLQSADPELGNKSPEDCVKTVKDVLAAVGVPLAVVGCGVDEVDNKIIPAVAEACAGENLLLGFASQENYNTIVAACMVHKHNLIAQTPLDINICKQLNILITEMGLTADKIVLDTNIGGLGYGIEYAYSILERGRLGTLQGDRMLAMPTLGTVGFEAWKAKEANVSIEEFPGWGEQKERGILWEAMTATALLQSGLDLLVMRHPEAVKLVQKNIADLMEPSSV
ncbi:corrinoid/iron-sulfur protein small subunit [Oxobacter pfennigii]|uniref:Corrinoid/iron-sulfur protein small subunit n=1 Tax=Oxobacter pfennigii TaxID=36849 RepID=A0A0P8W6X9_9CLOT|nr:acetyl-CoA decarbonylase/synthase complex subunit delta [Oxobacter pfennigii]KPU43815.1 corrinoid/iron-sulfur protein small subunit [Oxobacter pfennigii]